MKMTSSSCSAEKKYSSTKHIKAARYNSKTEIKDVCECKWLFFNFQYAELS